MAGADPGFCNWGGARCFATGGGGGGLDRYITIACRNIQLCLSWTQYVKKVGLYRPRNIQTEFNPCEKMITLESAGGGGGA